MLDYSTPQIYYHQVARISCLNFCETDIWELLPREVIAWGLT